MSSAQRSPRRRSARLAFDEEDAAARPAKKAKVDDHEDNDAAAAASVVNGTSAQQPAGRKAAAAAGPKKAKASYDEDADGFQFTRAPKSKKAPPKRRSSVKPAVAKDADATTESTKDAAPAQSGRKKRTSQQASPRNKTSPPKRRSARLSGEKGQDEQPQPESQAQSQPQESQQHVHNAEPSKETVESHEVERGRARTPQENQLHVEKKRSPTKIALPFADTPVILRNKEMRKHSGETRRRSSSQMRGRRASSLIDSGTSNAIPHSEVDVADFYKHIHQDLTEPRRMKQLLIWCGTRALPERPTGSTEDVNAALAARVIQEELLKDFANKSEMSDWFNRDDVAPTAVIKKPNPRNVQNAAKLQELESEVKRLKQEKAKWDVLLGSLSSSLDSDIASTKASASNAPPAASLDASLLSPEEQSTLSEFTSQDDVLSSTVSQLQALTRPVEFQIDSFADGVHKLEKYKEMADGVVERVMTEAATVLDERDKAAMQSAGMEKVSVRDLLKSLSRTAERAV